MNSNLHLTITTPTAILVDVPDATSVRAEDESGGFGILAGHANFLTVLSASVVRWRDLKGAEHYCAQSGGVLTVADGNRVLIACRQGARGEVLSQLEDEVRAMQASVVESDRKSRVEQTRLHANAVRQLMNFMRPDKAGPGSPSAKAPSP
jgi:F-type H+-transporting ATPase subunit epsilon